MAVNRVEVVINGNILSLQGDASEEHMQRVARVINEKLSEIQGAYEKGHLPVTKQNQLLALNLADECVKKQDELQRSKMLIETLTAENKALKEAAEKAQHKNHTNRGR